MILLFLCFPRNAGVLMTDLSLAECLFYGQDFCNSGKAVVRPARFTKCGGEERTLLFLDSVFHAAHGILDLALDLVSLTIRLQLGVAQNLASGDLDIAFGNLGSTFDAIFVHDDIPMTASVNSLPSA